MAGARLARGWQQAAETGSVLGSGYHEVKTRKTGEKLGGYYMPKFEVNRFDEEEMQQLSDASKCGPVCLPHGMN